MSYLPDVDYETHPDAVEVTFLGKDLTWFLGAESFRIAEEKHDVPMEDLVESFDFQQNGSMASGIDAIARLVWIGFLVFDEDLTLDEVRRKMSFPPEPNLIKPITAHLNRLKDEDLEDMAPADGGSGNG